MTSWIASARTGRISSEYPRHLLWTATEKVRRNPETRAEQRVMINQPIDTVLKHLRDGTSMRERPAATTDEPDPTFERAHTFLGRSVAVHYTLYAVPGGTQVTAATAQIPGDGIGTVVARAWKRQIETYLEALKTELE